MSQDGAKRCKMSADDGAGAGDTKRPYEVLMRQEDEEEKGEEEPSSNAYSWQPFYRDMSDGGQISIRFPGDGSVDNQKRWSKRVDTFSSDEEVILGCVHLYPGYPDGVMEAHNDYWTVADFPLTVPVTCLRDFQSIEIGDLFFRFYQAEEEGAAWPTGYYLCEKR
jgi:hypothetical protein